MKRSSFIGLLVLAISVLSIIPGFADDKKMTEEELEKWAKKFMQDAIVIDGHCDTIGSTLRGFDLSKRNDRGHIDIPRMMEAGMNGQFFACFIYPSEKGGGQDVQNTLRMIDGMYEAAAKDDRLVIAFGAKDIIDAKKAGKTAGILAIESGSAINDDIRVLRMFHKLGVRYMTLTWMNSNNWADASGPDQSRYGNKGPHGGLTKLGEEIVKEMNRLGMIVDISHVHDDTFWDVMKITTKPVIASHSCTWAVNPHFRNLKDDMLKALAKNDGVIGINFAAAFLSADYNKASEETRAKIEAEVMKLREKYKTEEEFRKEARKIYRQLRDKYPSPPVPSIKVLVDHIEHAAKVAGYDHVGLGSDFDGIGDGWEGMDDITSLYKIVMELKRRDWSDENIRKFLGLNFLRVIKANAGY